MAENNADNNIEKVLMEEQIKEQEERRKFSLLSIIEFFRDLFFIATGAIVAIFSKDTYKDVNIFSKNKSKNDKKEAVQEGDNKNTVVQTVVVEQQDIPPEKADEENKKPEYSEEKLEELLKGNIEDRVFVAKQGYALDRLVNDPAWEVRFEVAEQGYGLDVLVNDPEAEVRISVAEKGYGLNVLANDPSSSVRMYVVDQGYGLNLLINDSNELVRDKAEEFLKKNNLSIEQWEAEYPDNIYSAEKPKPSLEDKVVAAEEKKNNAVSKPKKSRNIDDLEIA